MRMNACAEHAAGHSAQLKEECHMQLHPCFFCSKRANYNVFLSEQEAQEMYRKREEARPAASGAWIKEGREEGMSTKKRQLTFYADQDINDWFIQRLGTINQSRVINEAIRLYKYQLDKQIELRGLDSQVQALTEALFAHLASCKCEKNE